MPSGKARIAGLYAIADSSYLTADQFVPAVRAALDGGARVIQYRDKKSEPGQREARARALNALCREHALPLLINDDVALAALVGAAGVHLGRDDPDIAAARAALGDAARVNCSWEFWKRSVLVMGVCPISKAAGLDLQKSRPQMNAD
jgi:thiamine-phosphate pyrophosphorylase